MTEYFTDPKDKFFSEYVNPLRWSQIYKGSFTAVYDTSTPKDIRTHDLSDNSFAWMACDGCGKERSGLRAIESNGHVLYLCMRCRGKV